MAVEVAMQQVHPLRGFGDQSNAISVRFTVATDVPSPRIRAVTEYTAPGAVIVRPAVA